MKRSVLLSAIVILLAACGSVTPPGPTTPPATGPTPPAGATTGPGLSGNLTLWHSYSANTPGVSRGAADALGKALDLVRTENPGLNLTVTEVSLSDLFISYQLNGASGTPDVIFAPNDNEGDIYRAGLSADLTGAFTPAELSRFSQLAVAGSTVDNKLVQAPALLRTVGIYYRSDRVPSFPSTTDDLVTAIHDNGLKLGIYQAIYQVFGFWGSFGGSLMDASGKCVADHAGVARAFDYYRALKDAGARWYEGDAYDAMAADFKSGALDAVIDGPWVGAEYRDAIGGNLAIAPLPAGSGGPALPMIGVDGLTVNPHTTNQALASDFAKRMVQPDVLSILSGQSVQIPADRSVPPADPLSAQFAGAATNGLPRPQLTQLGAFWGRFTTALNDVLDKDADPRQAVDDACAQMNADNGL